MSLVKALSVEIDGIRRAQRTVSDGRRFLRILTIRRDSSGYSLDGITNVV